ncbi:SWIM zinc finger family protein [Haloferax sp. Atlit-6N]|uniref:SWIM zinc finger family protein n=1 Tax=Haloferax sp. Atlit-6N TaxID=2077205 RepID=UPI001F173BC2|nr:SWIM zinc finger family protein [Haloferax sp. Atlit-6N]
MTTTRPPTRQSVSTSTHRGHDLVRVTEWLPGSKPTDYDIELSDGDGYRTRFWRCRNCGHERNRRDEFREPCRATPGRPLVSDGGYAVEDSRTWKALTESMTVRFGTVGPRYEVDSSSGNTYEVDIAAGTCSCPDHQKRGVECKHLRRVLFELRTRILPQPDGRFARCERESRQETKTVRYSR